MPERRDKIHMMNRVLAVLIAVGAMPALAQSHVAFTAADYSRAEKFMSYNVNPLVDHNAARPHWLSDSGFWYRVTTGGGSEYVLVDPANGGRTPAFNHARLAATLSTASGTPFDAHRLPFSEIEFSDDMRSVSFDAAAKRWKCSRDGSLCVAEKEAAATTPRTDAPSPDKKRTAFIREYNVWVRDLATGKETQLTKDGIKDFGYATDNAGWSHSDRPIVAWSPDSKKTRDLPAGPARCRRNVPGENARWAIQSCEAWKYPLPGDAGGHHHPARDHRRRRPARGPTADARRPAPFIVVRRRRLPGGEWADVQWSADRTQLAFVSTSRDHKREQLRIADASHRRQCATCWKNPSPRSTNPATAA